MEENPRLPKKEYIEALRNSALKVTTEEMNALLEAADRKGDGLIELKHFRDHFYDILKLMRNRMAFMRLANVTQI